MEEASDEEMETTAPPKISQQPTMPGQPPLPTTSEPVIIRQYDPKQSRPMATAPQADQWLISPLTQERIPAHKLQEHMKISKWPAGLIGGTCDIVILSLSSFILFQLLLFISLIAFFCNI